MEIRNPLLVVVITAALASPGLTQNYIDTFSYSAGTTIPGYVEQRGDWSATGSEVQCDPSPGSQYLVLPTITSDIGAVECVCIHDGTSTYQSIGPLMRYSGIGLGGTYMAVRLLALPGDIFDRLQIVHMRGNSALRSTWISLPQKTKRARVRLVVQPTNSAFVQVLVDVDLDGGWDLDWIIRAYRHIPAIESGNVGVYGFGGAKADDLKYYAVPFRAASPGLSLVCVGFSEPNRQYCGFCSLSRRGFDLPDGGRIPLAFDSLFLTSIFNKTMFVDFSGTTQNDGGFVMRVNPPNVPGLRFYVGAVVFVPGKPVLIGCEVRTGLP